MRLLPSPWFLASLGGVSLALSACAGDTNYASSPEATDPAGLTELLRDGQRPTPMDVPRPDLSDLMSCSAAMPSPGELPAEDDDARPAPASIGADIPLSYFGPAPSETNPRLIGPLTLLTAGSLDEDAGTVRLPLYEGRLGDASGPAVWYVLTDTSDADNAAALGLNHAAKLAYADTGRGVRDAYYDNVEGRTMLIFEQGSVDFSPVHTIVPGDTPQEFPPASAQPGSVGDEDYSPLVRIANAGGHVYNAPIVAFGTAPETLANYCDGAVDLHARTMVHDKVLAICPSSADSDASGTVTLALTSGFSFGRPVLYLSLDANAQVPAALEGSTLAPGLDDIQVGADDSAFSAVERIFVTTNGPINEGDEQNPQRQGLTSALRGEGGPLNVLGGMGFPPKSGRWKLSC